MTSRSCPAGAGTARARPPVPAPGAGPAVRPPRVGPDFLTELFRNPLDGGYADAAPSRAAGDRPGPRPARRVRPADGRAGRHRAAAHRRLPADGRRQPEAARHVTSWSATSRTARRIPTRCSGRPTRCDSRPTCCATRWSARTRPCYQSGGACRPRRGDRHRACCHPRRRPGTGRPGHRPGGYQSRHDPGKVRRLRHPGGPTSCGTTAPRRSRSTASA